MASLVSLPRPARPTARRALRAFPAPAAAVGLLGAALSGAFPGLLALGMATALAALAPATLLIRLALHIHRTTRSYDTCRGAGFIGVAVLAGGLTTALVPLVATARRPAVVLGGGVTTAALFLLGMLLLPGTAPSVTARLRRGLDGLSVGISLTFAGWLLMPAAVHSSALVATTVLLAISAVSMYTIAGLRAARFRTAAACCASGAGLAVLGLAGLAVLVNPGHPAPAADTLPGALALIAVALPLLAAPELAWAGARMAGGGQGGPSGAEAANLADPEGTFTGYPVLTVPASVGALAAGYHLLEVGEFDTVAVVLGIGVAAGMATREVFSAVEIRTYARRLAAQEAHFRSLVAGANDVTMVVGEDMVVRWQSPAAARQFGLSDAEVLGRPFTRLLHPEDVPGVLELLQAILADPAPDGSTSLVEARLRDGFGRWRDTESTVSDQRGTPHVAALVIHVRDVGERKHLERTLHRLAFTDQLTGLPNRRELMRTITAQRGVAGHPGALLVVDLHDMSAVNEQCGREVGDAVLIEVARRLRTSAGPDGLPARLAGDEFAVLTVDGPVQAYALGTRLLGELTRPVELPGCAVGLQVSIGLADLASTDGVEEVLGHADLARLRARQLGRNRVEWYDDYLAEQLSRQSELERELPGAAGRGELDLVFQPVLSLPERRPVGVEALLRWRHPRLGTVPPADFIPVAEQLGVIGEIGDWVLGAACRQLSSWQAAGRDVWVSVNVSPRQLAAPDFVAGVAAALAAHDAPAEQLIVEVAESGVATDPAMVINQLAGVRALGVRAALDHFGAGQASLTHLRRLPVDLLKIDCGLFAERDDSGGPSMPMIDIVVGLGRRLGLEIVAEGVEADDQLSLAQQGGCRYGQGHLLGYPAPVEHVEAFFEEARGRSR